MKKIKLRADINITLLNYPSHKSLSDTQKAGISMIIEQKLGDRIVHTPLGDVVLRIHIKDTEKGE
jgi:hypothetical protein